MKNIFMLFCCVFMTHIAIAQEETSYLKMVNVEGSSTVLVNVDIPAAVKEWDGDKLRILVDVQHQDGVGAEILESLLQIGRYEVMTGTSNGELIIKMPGLNNEIVMGGKVIQEAISLLIFAPKGVSVDTDLDQTIGARISKNGGFNEPIEIEFEFNIPFMVSFGGESTQGAKPKTVTSNLQLQLEEKGNELQKFVGDMATMQQQLENAYKDEMTPEDHEAVNTLLMEIEQKNQDLQTLINELSNLQSEIDNQ